MNLYEVINLILPINYHFKMDYLFCNTLLFFPELILRSSS